MTDTPKPDTEAATETAAEAVEDIVELVFRTNPALVLAAFVAGALLIAGIVYYMGTRTIEAEGETDAAD